MSVDADAVRVGRGGCVQFSAFAFRQFSGQTKCRFLESFGAFELRGGERRGLFDRS
jgi:hypothetical protein